ncbi:hypothetical protein N9C66_04660 [Akkermansiaceae bacterium]|nr:hypothetical protein [Akkermansiaceae bacterium]MDB4369956.1 hypothetical protein [Akkermansiaceae bacterium]MDB4384351.1 hypothetical protein [Akkermansiaceae bacterium]MDB4465731.1 hypothetical protein [Akkermansiaceae bacterium]
MDTLITVILLSLFGASLISGILSQREITKFTKWLHANRYHHWLKLRAPGTPFWKGEGKPGQEPRYRSHFNGFSRNFINKVPAFIKKFKEDEAQKILQKYQSLHRFAFISLIAFGVMIFIAVLISPK